MDAHPPLHGRQDQGSASPTPTHRALEGSTWDPGGTPCGRRPWFLRLLISVPKGAFRRRKGVFVDVGTWHRPSSRIPRRVHLFFGGDVRSRCPVVVGVDRWCSDEGLGGKEGGRSLSIRQRERYPSQPVWTDARIGGSVPPGGGDPDPTSPPRTGVSVDETGSNPNPVTFLQRGRSRSNPEDLPIPGFPFETLPCSRKRVERDGRTVEWNQHHKTAWTRGMARSWRAFGVLKRAKRNGWTKWMHETKGDACRAESGRVCTTSAAPCDEEGRRETNETTRSKCWSCASSRGPRDTFFCRACEVILPPDVDKNFFELLGIGQPSLQVDVKELEQIYRDLQKRLHPDKFSKAGEKEKELSEQQASLVNAAYHTLKTPLGRLRYLLQVLEEVPDVSEDTIQDPEMLMEVMEAREQVESTDDKDELKTIQKENQDKFDDLYVKASKAYQEKNIEALMDLTNRMIYVAKVEEEIIAKL